MEEIDHNIFDNRDLLSRHFMRYTYMLRIKVKQAAGQKMLDEVVGEKVLSEEET